MKSYFSRLMNVFNPFFYNQMAVICCVLAGLLLPPPAGAQQDGCFRIDIDQVGYPLAGDTVCVPVTVSATAGLASAQFTVFYDTTALQGAGVKLDLSAIGPVEPSAFFLGNGVVRWVWFDPNAVGIDVPENGVLFELCFVVKPDATPGLKKIYIDPDTFTFFEMMRLVGLTESRSLPFVHQTGGVWVGTAPGATFDVLGCVGTDTCGRSSGSASLSMVGGTPPYSVIWEGPAGFVSNDLNIQGVQGGLYEATVEDALGLVRTVVLRVPQTANNIEVVADITPSTCNQPTGCVRLSPMNGVALYDYAWSNGVQGAQVCNLPPGPMTVTVTNAQGCFKEFVYDVPNSQNFIALLFTDDIDTCGGTGAAEVFVVKDGTQYSYLWSTGDTTQVVTGLPEGFFKVTVSAGPLCSKELGYYILNQVGYDWNLQLLKSPCAGNDNSADLVLKHFPGAKELDYPLRISWADGTTRQIDVPTGNQYLDTLLQVPFGQYAVTVTSAEGCSRHVSAVAYCAPETAMPDSLPFFYVEDAYLDAQFRVDSCVGIYASQLHDITELAFNLNIHSNAHLREIRNVQLPGALPGSFIWDSTAQNLRLEWESSGGLPLSLPPNALLFEVCLAPKFQTNQTYTYVGFTDKPSPPRVINTQQRDLGFIGLQGYVLYGLHFPPDPAVCAGGVETPDCTTDNKSRVHLVSCDPDSTLLLYYLSHNGIKSAPEALLFADSGTYFFNVDYTGLSADARQVLVYIPGRHPANACVWPGDFDNNNAVNQYDLLYLGLAYGTQGAPRADASLDWLGQSATDWPQSTGVRQVNFKNIDGNGDGVLNGLDTTAILQNWGRVIRPASDNPFDMPLSDTGYLNMPIITLDIDTLQPGQQAYLPIALGTPQAPVDSLYGMAFSISYDPDIIVPASVRFYPQASWFGDPDSNLIWIQRNYPALGRLDVAVTRTDGRAVSGSGIIGDMFIVIEDNIFFQSDDDWAEKGASDPDSLKKSQLFFSGIGTLVSGETPGSLNGAPVEVVVKRQTIGVGGVAGALPGVRLFPNPAQDVVWVESAEQGIERVEVVDQHGRLVSVAIPGRTQTARVSLVGLQEGLYWVRTVARTGISVQKLVIDRQ